MSKKISLLNLSILTALSATTLISCGKSVDLASSQTSGGGVEVPKPNPEITPEPTPTSTATPTPTPTPTPTSEPTPTPTPTFAPKPCTEETRSSWNWTQPDLSLNRSVDVLFVIDTSASLVSERQKLARAVPRFLDQLPKDADVRVATILAHGAESRWSGKLYSHDEDPRVLAPMSISPARAEKYLSRALERPALDSSMGSGELLMYALQRSLEEEPLAEIQSQGFFRANAALAIVFITDENDLCFDPKAHGYTKFPHYNSSFLSNEKASFKRYCVDGRGTVVVSTTSVISTLQEKFPGKKVTMAGIVHQDPKEVPYFGEDAIGHGIIELIEENASHQATGSSAGLILEITSKNYAPALASLASQVSTSLTLLTSFPLGHSLPLDMSTLIVNVDGHPVLAIYDPVAGVIQIDKSDAGGAGSKIEVSACFL